MAANLNLNYYYGAEAEQYNFYRIPKVLLTDRRYSGLSLDAKFLYGLLLDRMGLSAKNGWMDRARRVYIYFTLEDAMEQIGCGHTKAVRLFAELEEIGLIERKRQGQGKPTRIYVKNFVLPQAPSQTPPEHSNDPVEPPEGLDAAPVEGCFSMPARACSCTVQTPERPVPCPELESRRTAPVPELSDPADIPSAQPDQDCQKAEVQTSQKRKSEKPGLPFSGTPDFRKTEVLIMKSDTELNNTEYSIYPYPSREKEMMRMDEMERYKTRIRENIDYNQLLEDYPLKEEILDGYVELMAEACCTRRDFIRIAGNELPSGVVKSRFLKINREHVTYVLDCMSENTTVIRNIKAYTMAALYNAPLTMQSYYAARVNHDLYGQSAS